MNERIWLVAKREFLATLVTRAFITMVLAPVIVGLSIPLVAAPVVFVAQTVVQRSAPADRPPASVVELVDPDGFLGARLADLLGEDFEVEVVSGGVALPDSPATIRVVVSEAEARSGRYRLEVEQGPRSREVRAVSRAAHGALTRARLEAAGLEGDVVDEAFEVERELVDLSGTETSEPKDIWSALQKFAVDNQEYMAPFGVLFIMFSSLSMAGQGLLTSTLEEKATRVSEVLLGAVSPVELLTGKALGQLGVGLAIAVVWGGPGLAVLWFLTVTALGPIGALYLLLFVAIASLSWAAVMGGVGSAMNDLTEAQGILAPLFMVMMMTFVPALLAIGEPESVLVLVLSILPPTAAPVMAARIASSVPPPHWQIWLSILTSGGFAVALLWAAGRLYRIGLLVRGSPPSVRTLLRWIRTG